MGTHFGHIGHFFSEDATLIWDSEISKGRDAIFDFLHRIPPFLTRVTCCDCQTVYCTPLTLVTASGILAGQGRSTRFHSTLYVETTDAGSRLALIKCQTVLSL
jgi:hypothetical protein